MGLLTTGGAPLRWGSEANNRAVPAVVAHGVQQFLNIYRNKRDLRNCPFIWGEEIEAQLVHIDEQKREVRLCLDAAIALERLRAECADAAVWQPEYGSFMVESTPAQPYTLDVASLSSIEANMRRRYHALDTHAGAGTVGVTLVTFPLMGVGDFTTAPLTDEHHRRQQQQHNNNNNENECNDHDHDHDHHEGSVAHGVVANARDGSDGAGPAVLDNKAATTARRHAVHDVSPYSLSLFVPDACINQTHPRFSTLTQNIRLRRGRKVCIQIPLYMDRYTLERVVDTRLNIDAHPRNKDINCCLIGDTNNSNNNNNNSNNSNNNHRRPHDTLSSRRTRRFGAASDEATTAAVTHKSDGGALAQTAVSTDATNTTATTDTEDAAVTTTTTTTTATAADLHEFSSATLYYYAQYFTGKQSEYVKARYDSCPCPARWVHQPCVYMDCMAFGMGCNCLQVTMQLADEPEARYAYDQLAILAPVFLAITSATPFQKGLLCDSDVRWLTIAASVDDRQPSEFPRIIKSRYDSISTFIGRDAPALEQFNDTDIAINDACYAELRAHDVDARLARHVAHLFIRDPLTIFDQLIDVDDATSSVHFENIQTTNWQSVRFKPPPVGGSIGWRVEFRVMEVMPTPFENAAFALFVALLAAAIVKYRPIFYTRVSLVDENIGRAHRIHPCRELYKMRKNIFCAHDASDAAAYTSSDAEVGQFSIDEIFNGREDGYVGLIPLVRRYVRDTYTDAAGGASAHACTANHTSQHHHHDGNDGSDNGHNNTSSSIANLEAYLRFISMRASGQIPTTAQYLRQFVMQHADYKHDSRITPRIAYDMVTRIHGLATGDVVDDAYLPMHAFHKTTGKRSREGDVADEDERTCD